MNEPEIPEESPEDRTRRLARERMRHRRQGGQSLADKARTMAIAELMQRHRQEFDILLAEKKLELARSAGSPIR